MAPQKSPKAPKAPKAPKPPKAPKAPKPPKPPTRTLEDILHEFKTLHEVQFDPF